MVFAFVPFSSGGCDKQERAERHFYDITAVYDETNGKLDATLSLSYVNASDAILDELYFHLYPAAYRSGAQFSPVPPSQRAEAYPYGVDYGGIDVKQVSVGGVEQAFEIGGNDEDVLVIPLTKELDPTQKTRVDVSFTVTVPKVRHRLGYHDGVINFGNWYPIACVKTEDGFDTSPYYSNGDPFFSECADYKVTLTVPSSLTAAMSGTSKRSDSGVTSTYVSTISNARDFAFVLGEFKVAKAVVGGTNVLYYYRKDTDAPNSLKTAADALAWFSESFGKYPYATYSVVETPFLSGGMEYAGLVYVSDSLNKSLTQEAIVHETAHQWWYGLVGSDQVNHAWMDEGLAEYSTTLFYEHNPDYGVTYKARMADAVAAYAVWSDVTMDDGVMEKKVCDFSEFDYAYATYLKGAILLDSVRKTIGSEAFFASLKAYSKQYAYRIAYPQDMISVFEQTSNRKCKTVFDSFLYGKAQIYR